MVNSKQIMNYIKLVSLSNFNLWDVKIYNNVKLSFKFNTVILGNILNSIKTDWVDIKDNEYYPILGIKGQGKGVYINRISKGSELTMKRYQKSKSFHLFYCKVRTVGGQWGVVYPEFEDSYGSSNMQYLKIDLEKITPEYIELLLKIKKLTDDWDKNAIGADGRHFTLNTLLNLQIPLPKLEEQKRIVSSYNKKLQLAQQQEEKAKTLETEIEKYLFEELGVQKNYEKKSNNLLQFVSYIKINEWGTDKIFNLSKIKSLMYEMTSLELKPNYIKSVFRGKSPKYSNNSNKTILNQKCNRWNKIELEHSKTVEEKWFNSIDNDFLTKEGDVIINSTGEGTIGRATYLTKENEGLLYDSHLLLLRVNKDFIDPLFYTYLFNSSFGQNQVNGIKSAQTTKQTELGVNNLKKIIFPNMPIEKQKQISNHINSIKTQIKELNVLSATNKEEAIVEFEKEIFN
ncbi:restriction endonuclease subunit S [Flavobacterium psychrophilum]